ncbi:MAG: hypothetical protein Kow0089_13990 [Desulfobulbaceae bacterium]
MRSGSLRWREVGWDGLAFRVPASWQPCTITPHYLVFADMGRPVLEVKWQQVRGGFSARDALHSIRSALPKEARLAEWKLPPELKHSLAGFETAGFRLEPPETGGHGVVLFCSACGRATILRWYNHNDADNSGLIEAILASFCDHPSDRETLWSLFDFRASLPESARLRSHVFQPGRFELRFELEGATITLYRFKPASVLLRDRPLADFGREIFSSALALGPIREEQHRARWQTTATGAQKILARIRRRPSWHWLEIRHDPAGNAILGVRVDARKAMDPALPERICASCKSLGME